MTNTAPPSGIIGNARVMAGTAHIQRPERVVVRVQIYASCSFVTLHYAVATTLSTWAHASARMRQPRYLRSRLDGRDSYRGYWATLSRDRVALGTCRPRHHWVRRRPREAGSEAFLCRIAGCALTLSRPAHWHMAVDHDIFCKEILREPTSARLRPPPIERTCKSNVASGQRRWPARWHQFVGHVTTHPLPTFQPFFPITRPFQSLHM